MDKTVMLSIAIEIKLMMQKAKYKKDKRMLYILNIGKSIVAIIIEIMPLKIPSNVELISKLAFDEEVVRNSSANRNGACKN
jgi:hypothetical protein